MHNMVLLWALTFFSLIFGANANCNVEECVKDINSILPNNTFICNNKISLEPILMQCMKHTNGTPCDTDIRMAILPKLDEVQKKFYDQCPGAREQRSDDCNLGTLFGCLGYFGTALMAPNFPLDDMDKFCSDLETFFDRVESCAVCAASTFISGWKEIEKDARYISEVVRSLINGGCECSKKITFEVDKIDVNASKCEQVKAAKGAVTKIANECLVPEINKYVKFDFAFLGSILIDSALAFSYELCLLFGSAQTLISSVTVILGGAAIGLMFGLNGSKNVF